MNGSITLALLLPTALIALLHSRPDRGFPVLEFEKRVTAAGRAWLALILVTLGVQVACGGGGSGPGPNPPAVGISYPQNPCTYEAGTAILPNRPVVQGGAPSQFAVTPGLPAGLALDPVGGGLSGTPVTATPAALYRVTATFGARTAHCDLTITVLDPPPGHLAYAMADSVLTAGDSHVSIQPSYDGGRPTRFSVAPALPPGLALDPATGLLEGCPRDPAPTAGFVITASNSGGSATATVVFAVRPAGAPGPLRYAVNPVVFEAGRTASPDLPSCEGIIAGYAVDPPLPPGLSLDPSSGAIGGVPVAATAPRVYQVSATNSGGTSTCALALTVVQAAESLPVTLDAVVTAGKGGYRASVRPGGTLYAWSLVNGTILSGQGTAAITYQAGTAGPLEARVAVDGAWGRGTATAVAPPAAHLFAQAKVFYGEKGILASVPPQAGMKYRWTLLPGTADGTITGSADGPVLAYEVGPSPGFYRLQVEVENLAGDRSSRVRDLEVVKGQFLKDVRTPRQRDGASLTVCGDGRVLMVGGYVPDDNFQYIDTLWWTSGPTAIVELFDPATSTWAEVAPIPTARAHHSATRLPDGTILVAGGQALDPTGERLVPSVKAEIYDPATDTWSVAGAMALARSYYTATLLRNGKVLVVGGSVSDRSAELYDPATRAWSRAAAPRAQRVEHVAGLLPDGKVLVTGGTNGLNVYFDNTAERYDPLTDTWSSAASPLSAHIWRQCIPLPTGRLLLAGGLDTVGNLGRRPEAELYDPRTDRWTATQSMQYGRATFGATTLKDGRILVVGGTSSSTYPPIQAPAELFDPVSNTWSDAGLPLSPRDHPNLAVLEDGTVLMAGGNLMGSGANAPGAYLAGAEFFSPATRSWSARGGMERVRGEATAVALADGRVLVAGGMTLSSCPPATELYDPATRSWSSAGALAKGRMGLAAALAGEGEVLVAGGADYEGNVLASVERYEAAANRWTEAAPLATGRVYPTATRLLDGRVLVAGGSSRLAGNLALASAEIYDPATGRWTSAGTLQVARVHHTATLLRDGTVLVAGGEGSLGSGGAPPVFNSAELYDPATNTWSPTGSMTYPKLWTSAILLQDGKVFMVGAGGDFTLYNPGYAETYDPLTRSWSRSGPVEGRRWAPLAALQADGRVFVLGGSNDPDKVLFAQIFDPVGQTWQAVPSGTNCYLSGLAVPLPDGRILIVGGFPEYIPFFWKP